MPSILSPSRAALAGFGALTGLAAVKMGSNASAEAAHRSGGDAGMNPASAAIVGSAGVGAALLGVSLALKPAMKPVAVSLGAGLLAGAVVGTAFHAMFAKPAIAALTSGNDPAPAPVPAPAPAPDPAPAPSSDGAVKAIDVSNWQPNPDWNAVKSAGIEVAYMKASEGKNTKDPSYDAKRSGAQAAGIRAGAYDYARPGNSSPDVVADAKAEAANFLKSADIKSGDMIPVLDLEEKGTLNKDELGVWTKTWLDEVEKETHVKPMIYTSPSFWSSNVNDVHGIAASHPLFLAHWDTQHPRPPGEWKDWTMWQYGSTQIPGFPKPVDADLIKDPGSLTVK